MVFCMKPQQFEQYCFYRLYSIDLDAVRHSLRMLKRYRRPEVRALILRDVIVTYSRPFSDNRGKFIKVHRLKVNSVPSKLRSLHNDIIDARNRIFVHTDFEYRDPHISRWPSAKGSIYGMAFRSDHVERFGKRLIQIEDLVKAVESTVNETIVKMETQFLHSAP